MKGCFRLLFAFRSCDEKWLSFAPVALLSLRAEAQNTRTAVGVYRGVLLSTQLGKCSNSRRFCACFDSDLGQTLSSAAALATAFSGLLPARGHASR